MLLNENVRLGQLCKIYLLVDRQNASLTKVPSPFHCDSVHFHSFEITSNKSVSFFSIFTPFFCVLFSFSNLWYLKTRMFKFKNVHYLHFVQFIQAHFFLCSVKIQRLETLICKASKGYVLHKTPRKNTFSFCD